MRQNPFDLDRALAELRAETAPADAHVRARRRLSRPGRPRLALRSAVVTGTLCLLMLPVVMRNRSGSAYAVELSEIVAATKAPPFVIARHYATDPDGKTRLMGERIWGPQRNVEKTFFGPDSLRETRKLPGGRIFERFLFRNRDGFRPYEIVSRTNEAIGGTDELGDLLLLDRSVGFLSKSHRLVPLSGDTPKGTRIFRLQSRRPGLPDAGVWTVQWPSKRILRIETAVGNENQITVAEYPRTIDPQRLDVPPLGWTWPEDFRHLAFPDPGPLPRYDLEREAAEYRRLSEKGLRNTIVGGVKVKLVGLFQCQTHPGMPLFVVYEAGEPGNDRKHPARLLGSDAPAGLTTMRRTPPKLLASVFLTGDRKGGRLLTSASVRIPIYRKPGDFVGYAEFRNVGVRQYSPELYSGLRVPSFH